MLRLALYSTVLLSWVTNWVLRQLEVSAVTGSPGHGCCYAESLLSSSTLTWDPTPSPPPYQGGSSYRDQNRVRRFLLKLKLSPVGLVSLMLGDIDIDI